LSTKSFRSKSSILISAEAKSSGEKLKKKLQKTYSCRTLKDIELSLANKDET
jgi:hypothetical protein